MDCAFVARNRVFIANRPEDLAHFPVVSSDDTLTLTTSTLTLTTESVTAACLPASEESLSPGSSTTSSTNNRSCRCIIDLSTRESMHRDFYNWLQGNDPQLLNSERPCIFDDPVLQHSMQQPSTSTDTLHFYPPVDDYPQNYYFEPPSVQPKTHIKTEPIDTNVEEKKASPTEKTEVEAKPKKKRGGSNRGTNLYGRAYCPGRPLSMDERYQIICLFQAGMKVNAISKQLCISHGCVSKIITRFRETGLLIPSSHAECRRRKRMLMESAAAQHQNPMNNG